MANPGSTPSRDRRLPPRNNVNANTAPNHAALQGALRAFNHASPPKSHPPMNMTGRPPVSLLDSDPEPPELPEPGSIKDKIAVFSANSAALDPNDRPRTALRSVPDITRQKSPQLLAAEIAVGSSPGPSNKTTGLDVQRAQLQRSGRALPSPIPIRKPMVNPRLLDTSLDDTQGFAPSKASLDQRPTSPRISTSPRPPITKPRPVPPPVPRKPLFASSESPSSDRRFENTERYDDSRSGPFPLRSKPSASTLPEEQPPALPPRRAATVSTQDVQENQLSSRARSPAWPSSSSVVSLYSQSQNPSSSSMLDSLTDVSRDGSSDAIAASSLASNRALQARKSPPPPPPQRRRRSRSRSLLHLQHQLKKDRTPSPSPGGFRETLRTQGKSDDEDERRNHRQHRNHIINKHPHKHQEGDRRRWRSEVTEKERKRYEGVWAANKGLLIPRDQVLDKKAAAQGIPDDMYPPDALEMVVNLVVRDIWSRSRLPNHVLEQIWNLVDRQNIGLLTRAEFVVGMWLIDQQLKGHKLPTEVPDSVWSSVTHVPGVLLESHYTKH
ncbi:hypothetical protein BDW62DRAFT_32786 [Aspergillus aurantiobrunneus]